VNYFRVNVVLYSAILDVFIAIPITLVLLTRLLIYRNLEKFEKLLITTILFLFGYILAISIPTVIDRSLSFYILEKIAQRGGEIRLEKFSDIFKDEYMKEHRLVDIRLTEQKESGTIEIEDGCVILTRRGELISTFSRKFRKNFLPKKRLLMGEYTNALVDPFRDSFDVENYNCK
jgi:hypothetical protein